MFPAHSVLQLILRNLVESTYEFGTQKKVTTCQLVVADQGLRKISERPKQHFIQT